MIWRHKFCHHLKHKTLRFLFIRMQVNTCAEAIQKYSTLVKNQWRSTVYHLSSSSMSSPSPCDHTVQQFYGIIYGQNHPVWKCQPPLPWFLCWCWHLAWYQRPKTTYNAIIYRVLNYVIQTRFHTLYCHKPFSLQYEEARHVFPFSIAFVCPAPACITTTLDAVS